jgi:hypothetical protein
MGETRVDLQHLLEDLRDAYVGSLEEAILAEIVANALDSGAGTIRFTLDPAHSSFTVVDDGSGMQRRELARYHDIASSTKARGEGIGFAGVGIKLGLLLCEEVITETRRGKTHVASRWHLASRHKAPWKWIPAPGFVPTRGTAVMLRLVNPLSPLLDSGFIEAAVRRHFQPLLEPEFQTVLGDRYGTGIRFRVNDEELARGRSDGGERAPLAVRLGRRRKPSAVGYLVRAASAVPEDDRGLAISTLGKVIKRGWDWIGVTPASAERIGGVIEVPELAECLTLNKADFVRAGPRGAKYLAYRKAIQEAVGAQLGIWGDARDAEDEKRRRAARPVERDLERVLVDLADDFPLLAALVERHAGGQRRLPIGNRDDDARALVAASVTALAESARSIEPGPVEAGPAPHEPAAPVASALALPGGPGPRRPTRYGLTIQFESRPHDPEPGRLVESTVWVNEAHPAYRRAMASRSEGYHIALAVALSLAPLAVEAVAEHGFVAAFLERWGRALEEPPRHAKRARSRPSLGSV